MSQSLVSVIVPAWNAEKTLAETLASAAAQTHGEIEVLIIDDGSTDRTPEIAADLCAADARFRLIQKPRGGLASARNRGIDEAKGAWIAPLDADDLWHCEKIARQLQTFAVAGDNVGLVYCWYRMIDDEGRVIERPWAPLMEGSVFAAHLQLNFGTGSTPLIRRCALGNRRYSTELSRVDGGGCEDWLLQLQIAADYDIACTRAFLVGYRARSDSMSSNEERMQRAHIQMYEIVRRQFPSRERRTIRRQLARWHALAALTQLRRRPTASLLEFGGALLQAPLAVGDAIGSKLRRRPAKEHPSVGKPFFDLSPDAR